MTLPTRKRYRFFIYRATFYPGGANEVPEERVIETDDPHAHARELCTHDAIHKVEFKEDLPSLAWDRSKDPCDD